MIAHGAVAMSAPAVSEVRNTVQLGGTASSTGLARRGAALPAEGEPEVLAAACLGLADYLRRCCLSEVVLSLSGGIDSALALALALALGGGSARGPGGAAGRGGPSGARQRAAPGLRFRPHRDRPNLPA